MNRRRVLAAIGGVVPLAGCLSLGQNAEPPDDSAEPPDDSAEPPDDSSEPSDDSAEPPDENAGQVLSNDLRFGHQITGSFTSDGPATLELKCTNQLKRQITATTSLGPPLPFSGRFGWNTAQNEQLLLYPDREPDLWFQIDENTLVPVSEVLPEESENGCWRVARTYDGIADPPGQVSREITAEGALTHQYTLYHMHECVPGTYSFSQSITLSAEGHDTEEYVPLILRVDVQNGGEISIEFFGIQEGYTP